MKNLLEHIKQTEMTIKGLKEDLIKYPWQYAETIDMIEKYRNKKQRLQVEYIFLKLKSDE